MWKQSSGVVRGDGFQYASGGHGLSRAMNSSSSITGGKPGLRAQGRWLARCSGGSNVELLRIFLLLSSFLDKYFLVIRHYIMYQALYQILGKQL